AKRLRKEEEVDGQSRAACRVLTARDCRPTVRSPTFVAAQKALSSVAILGSDNGGQSYVVHQALM
ncbi:MAG: hypothetical protein ACTHK7_23535, partial [Aureliella sp.]